MVSLRQSTKTGYIYKKNTTQSLIISTQIFCGNPIFTDLTVEVLNILKFVWMKNNMYVCINSDTYRNMTNNNIQNRYLKYKNVLMQIPIAKSSKYKAINAFGYLFESVSSWCTTLWTVVTLNKINFTCLQFFQFYSCVLKKYSCLNC